MDVSLYNFVSQKALHQGLQYARSFGHRFLEVEHIALAMLRADAVELGGGSSARLQHHLQKHLAKFRRVFGTVKIEFGNRLDIALDEAEKLAGKELVSEDNLWKALSNHSEVLKKFFEEDKAFGVDLEITDDPKPVSDEKKEEASAAGRSRGPKKKSSHEDAGKKDTQTKANGNYQIPEKLAEVLGKFTIDLTAMAERGELDPVIGRDAETRQVIQILGRKKKNNPILIGEAGVGKTAVAEFLALRIAEGKVPESVRGKRVLSLDLGGLVAGAKFRGEFEERMKNLLKAIQACGGEIILFIDEIHLLVGAGKAEGSADAANLLKPALARGELRCLGATTLDEFRTYIEKDPALERRFQPVKIEEPSRSATLAILRGVKSRYEIHHGVQINDEALVSAVDFSERFLPNRRLPDKAIDLLDESCSRLRMQIDSLPVGMDNLRAKIEQLQIEKKAIDKSDKTAAKALNKIDVELKTLEEEYRGLESIRNRHKDLLDKLRKVESRKAELDTLFESSKQKGDFEFAAKLQYVEMPKANEETGLIANELTQLQSQYSWLRQVVGSIEIAEVISAWSGVPATSVVKDEAASLLTMESRMGKRVFGQPEALLSVCKAIRRARVGVNDPNRPLGVFLFIGPTGVGKTEAAKALAAEVFDDESRMVRIDMSEYMEQHNISRLIGSPPGYIGHGEGGELTEAVRRTPYTVVLFDEIEKAHPRVLDLLLQTFDDGRLTDGNGRLINFKHTLIIMTSNIPLDVQFERDDKRFDDDVRGQLAKVLRPEFVGRIDEVILFHKLGRTHLEQLLERKLAELNSRLLDRQFHLALGSALKGELMAMASSGQSGGRALRRGFQIAVVDRVSERLLQFPDLCKGAWVLEVSSDGGVVWNEDATPGYFLNAAS